MSVGNEFLRVGRYPVESSVGRGKIYFAEELIYFSIFHNEENAEQLFGSKGLKEEKLQEVIEELIIKVLLQEKRDFQKLHVTV